MVVVVVVGGREVVDELVVGAIVVTGATVVVAGAEDVDVSWEAPVHAEMTAEMASRNPMTVIRDMKREDKRVGRVRLPPDPLAALADRPQTTDPLRFARSQTSNDR